MNTRIFWFLLLLLSSVTPACKVFQNPTGPLSSSSGWASTPVFDAGALPGKRFRVTCEDPARSSLAAALTKSFSDALAAKGYVNVDNATDADLQCVLVVRYFGKTAPPDGHLELIAQAGEPIQGGAEDWLAPDGSGYDTQDRKPRALKFRSGTRSRVGEIFRGREDDQWTLLVDVAIGARTERRREVHQRHEGRVWASTLSTGVDRASAAAELPRELAKRWRECLP